MSALFVAVAIFLIQFQVLGAIELTTPEISQENALEIALNTLGINAKDVYGEPQIKLYIYYHQSKPYLSYIVKLNYVDQKKVTVHNPIIIINANNGDVLQS